MRDDISQDPYRLGPEDIEDPPRKFAAIFRRIGPTNSHLAPAKVQRRYMSRPHPNPTTKPLCLPL